MGMNMNKLMKQAQKMQADMARLQGELENKEFEVSSGGGMVTVRVNGKQDVLSLKINPECVDPNDVEMLEDLVLAAIQDAINQSKEEVAQEMSKVTGGMKIPGLF
ncbi:MAG: YbaB/EbfC family nucleoid-associated protein [Clostridia bacterium]